MDAIVTAAQAAVTDLTGERGLRHNPHKEEMPRLFVYNPEETVEIFEDQQERTTTQVQAALYADVEQEAMAVYLDEIRDQIRSDKTLGGVVLWTYVASRAVSEHNDAGHMVGVLTFFTVQES